MMNSRPRIFLIIILLLNSVIVSAKISNDIKGSLFHFYNTNEVIDFTTLINKDGGYQLFYTQRMADEDNSNIVLKQAVSEDLFHWHEKVINNAPFSIDKSITWGVFEDYGNKLGDSSNIYMIELKDKEFQLKVLEQDEWKSTDISFTISGVDISSLSLPTMKWNSILNSWVIFLTDIKGKQVSVFTSSDLTLWNQVCRINENCPRPEMFENNGKTFVLLGDNCYEMDFTKKGNSSIISRRHIDYGGGYCQTLITTVGDDIVFMGGLAEDNFYQANCGLKLSSPKIVISKDDNFYYSPYIKGITMEKGIAKEDKKMIPGLGKNLLSGKFGDAYVLEGNIKYNDVTSYGFLFKVGSKSSGYELRYYKKQNIYQCTGGEMAVKPVDDYSKVLIVVDNGFIDFYYGDGAKVMSVSVDYVQKAPKIILFNQGGEIYVKNIRVNPLSFNKK
ncbi:hypothetical protein OAT16_11570 [Prolixibacteraceae bacterium]|nr:hypothetical protein [Prolixibacteraceae bacterium]